MSLKNRIIGALAGATLLGGGITSVVKVNEGYSESAYQDSAGVWTICYGETKGVKKGMWLSKSACNARLVQSIGEHAEALVGLPESLPDVIVLGSIDMTYNVGIYGFKNSTIKRKLMQGDYKGAGAAVLAWRYITLKDGTKYDCSQLVNGKPNRVCWGLWERRQWQSKAIGYEYKTVQEAVDALVRLKNK